MNIEKLELTTYKNYKALCEVLDEPFKKSGNSRDSQLKEWRRYFNFEKQGHKIIVTEIYDFTLEKEDGRKNNTFVQRYEQPKMFNDNQIEQMVLLQFLRHYLGNVAYPNNVEISYTVECINFFSHIGLCNHNYRKLSKGKNKLSSYNYSDEYYCHSKIFDLALGNAYHSMQSKVLGSCCEIKLVKVICLEINGCKEYHVANDEEAEIINRSVKEVLAKFNEENNMQLTGMGDVYYKASHKASQIIDDITKQIQANGIEDFHHWINNFEIKSTKEHAIERLRELGIDIECLDDVKHEIKFLRDEVNKIFLDAQHERIEKACDKKELEVETRRKEKKLIGRVSTTNPKYVLLDTNQQEKAHNLVDYSHKNLNKDEQIEAYKLIYLCEK